MVTATLVQPIDPLHHDVAIVDQQGHPTPQFMRQWSKSRAVSIAADEAVKGVGDLNEQLENYYTKIESDALYETQTHAAATYETTAHAAATYETQAHAAATYSLLGHTHSAADITSGNLNQARLPSGAVTWTSTSVNVTGTFTVGGVAASLAGHAHSAADIASGTLNTARLVGAYTGVTDVGTLATLAVTGISTLTGDVVAGMIRRGTADGSDNSFLFLTGGGFPADNRGGSIALHGNEAASGPGAVRLITGTPGAIEFYTGASVLRGQITSTGVFLLGTTQTTGMAAAGGMVLANDARLYSVTFAGTSIAPLIGSNTSNYIVFGYTGANIQFPASSGLAFFGGAPVVKPTGVAVTAAGIHAALVSLSLIS